ncbi:MAG: hypothetical protein J6A49_04300 [Clostridia bacterium]|nr:hypothetical protein [Clostridia bacterium]
MKKILSVLLVAVLLISSLGLVSVVAEESTPALSYTVTGTYTLGTTTKVTKELFNVDVVVDSSKIAALDGESKAYTYEVVSIVANGIDYFVDEEAFFAAFDSEDFAGTTLEVTLQIDFESDKVFGTLDYTVNVSGFMAPLSLGMGAVDSALSNVALPIEIVITGDVWQFPCVDEIQILQRPTKQDYLDNEKFNFEGSSIAVQTKVAVAYEDRPGETGAIERFYIYEPGYSGLVEYDNDTQNMFTSNPSEKEKLNINTTEVIAYFDGIELAKLPVHVDHAFSKDFVSITTDFYTEAKPGYHAIVCDGCGEAHNAQPHIPTPILDENGEPLIDEEGEIVYWTSNNDQTFLKNGTESSICQDCGAVLTRRTASTADYNEALGNYHFIRVILDYINLILNIIDVSLGK